MPDKAADTNDTQPVRTAAPQPALRILGQEFYYPTSVTGAVSLCFATAAACVALAIVYVWANPAAYRHVEHVLKASNINAVNDANPTSEVKTGGRFEFWAPSTETYATEEPLPDRAWQKGVTAEKIAKFESKLDEYCTGWRRHTVFGKGTTGAKAGFWYSMTIKRNFQEDDFADMYRNFWQSKSPVFTEYVATKSGYKAASK